jgi:hypothetical protein
MNKYRKTETDIINAALVAGTVVSVKDYADARFEAVKNATDTALTAQKEAVASALAAQKEATAAALAGARDKGTGRQEIWAYVIGALGLAIAAMTAFFTRH